MSLNIIKALAVTAEATAARLSEIAIEVMAQDLSAYPEPQVIAALRRCRAECNGRLTLREVIERIDQGNDGHPAPNEAWGMLLAFVNDEGATGFYTEQMQIAWRMCQPIIDAGDQVGARMCFLETYRKALDRAVERRQAPRWMVTLGTDLDRRKMELDGAIRRGMISRDHAQSLLPPPQQQDGEVAGLLKHEGAGGFLPQDSVAKKVQEILATLRMKSDADTETPAMRAEQERNAAIEKARARVPVIKQPLTQPRRGAA